mmetsp:Transcript_7071/g.13858  ORF Transcript_7071/g.13858 Transcript_7071/m.13858 type:complete len:279 (+) Transcript_7071:159-995(+)
MCASSSYSSSSTSSSPKAKASKETEGGALEPPAKSDAVESSAPAESAQKPAMKASASRSPQASPARVRARSPSSSSSSSSGRQRRPIERGRDRPRARSRSRSRDRSRERSRPVSRPMQSRDWQSSREFGPRGGRNDRSVPFPPGRSGFAGNGARYDRARHPPRSPERFPRDGRGRFDRGRDMNGRDPRGGGPRGAVGTADRWVPPGDRAPMRPAHGVSGPQTAHVLHADAIKARGSSWSRARSAADETERWGHDRFDDVALAPECNNEMSSHMRNFQY